MGNSKKRLESNARNGWLRKDISPILSFMILSLALLGVFLMGAYFMKEYIEAWNVASGDIKEIME
ncbi:hypothetical protein B6D52_02365 [Candidatus Parcubacteria bacterium 4484_255]|nr:MAG: hypothetical protein B6D52_02365 [Candidatus Parcubacteria bacterium 4484_255]